jgi:hypothetical protein
MWVCVLCWPALESSDGYGLEVDEKRTIRDPLVVPCPEDRVRGSVSLTVENIGAVRRNGQAVLKDGLKYFFDGETRI